jgi:glycosyltransferase involved in cell wall biosynthesis
VETHSPDQVAEALLELMENPDLARRMGENGLKYAACSTWGKQSEKLFSFIDRVLEGP